MNEHQNQQDSFDQKKDELVGEMKQETQRYVNTAKDYLNTAADKVGGVVEQAKEKGDEVRQHMQDKGQEMKQQLMKAGETADKYAHERPWHLVAFAAVVGFAFGMLCRDNKRPRHD